MELTGVQAEVRAAAVWQEGRWGDRTGLSHSTVGHRFPWGAIQLSRESAQLGAELSEPDRSAGPSSSRDLAGGDLEHYVETPLPLSSDNQSTPSAQLVGDNKTCPLAVAQGLELAQGPRGLPCARS